MHWLLRSYFTAVLFLQMNYIGLHAGREKEVYRL